MDLNETKDATSKGSKRALLALIFAFLLAGAGVVAYLTAHDSVINLFSFAGEDKDVTVEWREVPPTIDVNHDGKFLVVRVAWNNTTATYVEGSATTTLDAYSVGNEGSFDAPDPYIFLADTQTEEQYQALLIGAEVNVTNSVVPVPTGNLFYIEKDRGSTEHPAKNGVTYSKYRMTVKPYTTTIIKESQLKKLLSVQPVEPQWSGYVHNGWTTPVKVGTDPDTGNDKYVVKSTWVKRSNPDVTEDSSYAAVYGDDTLVFGRGAAPGSYEGKSLSSQNGVACTWYDIEDAVYSRVELPWRDMKPNIKSVVVKDAIAPKSIAFWFETMGNLASVDLSKLDASKVEDAQSLFGNDALVSTIDLSMLDMPKVKNISNMFYGCKGATSLKIPGGFTNELKEMGQVFYDCISVKELNLEGLDVSGVTNMGRLFWNCQTLTTVFVDENWDVQHIRVGIAEGIYDDHGQMFSGCTNLVGGNGTKCENRLGEVSTKASIQYANIDQWNVAGYLTCFNANTGKVTLEGKTFPGSVLTATTQFIPSGKTLAYQWLRDGSPIPGAINSQYTTSDDDDEHEISCQVVVDGRYTLVSNTVSVGLPTFAVCGIKNGTISLKFYKRADIPSVEDEYDGSTVLAVYKDFEHKPFSSANDQPWAGRRTQFAYIEFVDEGIRPVSTAYWFDSCHSVMNIYGLEKLDTSSVTDITDMFHYMPRLASLDLTSFDVSNVENASGVFHGCSSLRLIKTSYTTEWNIPGDTSYMFYGCGRLIGGNGTVCDSSDLEKVNGSYAISDGLNGRPGYFTGVCKEDLTGTVEVSGGAVEGETLSAITSGTNTGVVLTYQWYRDNAAINGATGSTYTLTEDDVSHSIHCVVSATNCTGSLSSNTIGPIAKPEPQAFAVYSADDNSLNFYKRSSIPNAGVAFEGKTATEVYTGFEEQATRPWSGQASNVTSVTFVDEGISPVSTASWFSGFSNCTSMDVSKLDTSKATSASQMFYGCSELTSLDVSSFSTANMTNMPYMFCECAKLDSLNISGSFSTENVTNMSYMFSRCKALTSIDVSGFNIAKVTNAKYMFSECQSLTSLDVSNWNTAAIKQFESMFNGCSALNSLDVSGFITSSATTLRSMFSGCSALTSLDVSGFNTAKVTNMSGMFTGCKSLTSLDVSGFNTARVTNMSYMFSACSALVAIYAGEAWSTGAVTTSTSMFLNCSALSGGMGTIYVPTKVDAAYAHIDGGETNPGYFSSKPDPALEGSVAISGEALVGSTLTASATLTSEGAEPSYQWCRDETAIEGATSSTYTLAESDIDHKITCVVTTPGFSGSLVSNEIGPVTKPKTEVEKQLESMTLHEKVCQMFCVYPEDLGGSGALTVAGSTQQQTLQAYPYGGVCYFLQNIKSESQAKTLVSTLESYSEIPLFHAVDEEGGRVQRIGGTTYSGAVRGAGIGNQLNAMYTYKNLGTDTAYNNAQLLAANLNLLGMNWDFAPVADVNSNPSNPVIGDRAYGDDFDATGELVASAVRGFSDAGVATSLKHFPGHGDTATDSHTGTAAVSKTLDQLRNEEFKSFKAGIAAGADSVMMGHLMIDGAKESVPTSCSYEFVTEVLRDELGFDGVITTDGMGMGALTKVFGTTKQGHIDAVMACLKAGIDVFLLPGDPAACVDAIEAAVASGEVSEDRIDASVKRILTLKEKIAANKSKRNAATLQAMHAAAVADEELTAAATQSAATGTKVGIEIDAQSAAVGDTLSLRAITEGADTADNVSYRWYVSSKEDMNDKALIENATQAQIEYLLNDPGTWYFQCEVTCGDQALFSDPIVFEATSPEGRQ